MFSCIFFFPVIHILVACYIDFIFFYTLKLLELEKLIEVLGKFVPLSIRNIRILTQTSLNHSAV